VGHYYFFLGMFTEFQKVTISFDMFVCVSINLSACNNLAPTADIFMKVDV